MKNLLFLFITIVTIIIIISIAYYLTKRLTIKSPKNNVIKQINDTVSVASSLDEKTLTSLSQVSELILKNNFNEELILKRPTELSSKKYREVDILKSEKLTSNIIQGIIPIIDHEYTLSELDKMAPNGIFTATVNPDKLSRFKDGTLTTMVRNKQRHLIANKGFKEIDLIKNVNPFTAINIGMQTMAAISGQYYLKRIFNNLDKINHYLNNLLEIHDNEKIAILINAQITISEISQRELLDNTDIQQLRDLRTKIGEIFYEYKPRLEKAYDEVKSYNSNKLQVEKRINDYKTKISDLIFIAQIVITSERLLRQIELTEIASRIKINYLDPTIPELCAQLKNHYSKSYTRNIFCNYDDIIFPVTQNAEKIIGNGKDFIFFDKDKNKLLEQITEKFKPIENILRSDYPIITEISEIQSKEQNLLILLDENTKHQRVFVPTVN